MKIIQILLLAALSISSAYSDEQSDDARQIEADMIRRIDDAKKISIPLPKITPYDADSKARAVYLEEYTKAYQLILAAVMVDCHMGIKGYYEKAFQDGWTEGRNAAMKDHPEKVAQMYGVPLKDYLRYMKEKSAPQQKQAEQDAAANP